MAEISAFPAHSVRTWLGIEEVMRSRLLLPDFDIEPEGVEYVLAQVRAVYEKCDIGREYSLAFENAEAFEAYKKHVWTPALDVYQPLIAKLLWEIAYREISLYHCNCGAQGTRAKPNNPPSSTADVIDFPPK